ncbi:hypothetical protein FT663_02414 [Candidozyma haemuli var. vulneris]|uniref:DH domain-containing protein n=1 Tax=Candidozyma haemuli TaxID=45357 RepID=A0A2V1ALL1_9ASCO|nr:hypothetical protein CXQ85_001488 [[Candida] haemuloni]KAF3992097.1 hypothetical protein FT663_02414 [[Candida] haemuloni var. vulneris]KAF3992715.1 hypothetical protein FT662_00924 [[Candida] haemuloni var. vulneris]PVH19187.1 hypothetical protein CXQ85_001488 [[Candida] haemuloni]
MENTPHPPFRSFSSASSASLNSSSTNITRVPSGPLLTLNSALNRTSSAQDHMYHKAKVMLKALAQVEGMTPYLNAAYTAAERCAEQQALALPQQLQTDGSSANAFRASVGSGGFSIHSGQSSASQNVKNIEKNCIFTFTAGILPASLSTDPVTELWKLLQQGVPLCLLFNAACPDTKKIEIDPSDDLNTSKKNVYLFLCEYQKHPSFSSDNMFTISDVYSDSSHDLLKVMKVVSTVLDKLGPQTPEENSIPDIGELKLTDDKSKVFRELIQTERKYLADLELLLAYKQELSNADAISSEQLHLLFPNLNEIVDFHRRLLNGFECNTNVPTKYQRIGSVFLHASNGPFKAYEPWTIGQISAIELINREAPNLRKASSILDPGFELQSYIIKPIQRLCKYPLLIKELIKAYSDCADTECYYELQRASVAMKDVANQVNEAQRRAENVGFCQSLMERVNNWRGFSIKDQGELLYHAAVAVKDGDNEKEYIACLFEQILFFFSEVPSHESKHKEKKMREFLTSRKKSSSGMSSSTANLLENLNSVKDKTSLELKGRVYVSEIYIINSLNLPGYWLSISWTGKKGSGVFKLRYKTEEVRSQWEACLRQLKQNEIDARHRRSRDSRGSLTAYESHEYPHNDSPVSHPTRVDGTPSTQRHHSSSSTMSMMKSSKNQPNSSRVSSSSTNGHQMHNEPVSPGSIVAINLIYKKSRIEQPLLISSGASFFELHSRISAHIASSATVDDDVVISKLKYKDEDGDYVVMDSNDDWSLAVDMLEELFEADETAERALTIWVS